MPRPLPAEFRLRAVALVRAGKTITRTAEERGVSQAALNAWVRQDKIDRGELPGISMKESAEVKKAKRRIRELEMEVEILRQASKILGQGRSAPKRVYPVIDTLVAAGFGVKKCCEVLGVSSAGYYLERNRPLSAVMIRRECLTSLIREIHTDSRGTYGSRRVHAELTKGRGIYVGQGLVGIVMHNAGIEGIPGPRKVKRVTGTQTSDDLVQRKFERSSLDELWVTDITEHPTREGKVYCCCVLDTCSRRIVGWSIDPAQDTTLVVNALDMAIRQRRIKKGSVVHADHGSQGEPTQFSDRKTAALCGNVGITRSMGATGSSYDDASAEIFWSIFKHEYFYRHTFTTIDELRAGISDYLNFYNHERRCAKTDGQSPIRYELSLTRPNQAAA